jgi:hypothetical protein
MFFLGQDLSSSLHFISTSQDAHVDDWNNGYCHTLMAALTGVLPILARARLAIEDGVEQTHLVISLSLIIRFNSSTTTGETNTAEISTYHPHPAARTHSLS